MKQKETAEMATPVLVVKRSQLPGAGKGLFTKSAIARDSTIVEYTGRITQWKEVLEGKTFNGYVYYINRNHVIDAMDPKSGVARYANDAAGLVRVKGLHNNAAYTISKKRVYITAIRNIQPGEEILVGYGKEYWDVVRENLKEETRSKKLAGR